MKQDRDAGDHSDQQTLPPSAIAMCSHLGMHADSVDLRAQRAAARCILCRSYSREGSGPSPVTSGLPVRMLLTCVRVKQAPCLSLRTSLLLLHRA